jgi:hypothetical protein
VATIDDQNGLLQLDLAGRVWSTLVYLREDFEPASNTIPTSK